MLIRPFREADVPALISLFRDTIRRVNIRDYSPEQVLTWAPDAIDAGAWANSVASRFVFVAEIDSIVSGFGELEPDGHVNRFYVHADRQRQGVGHALLDAIEARARLLCLSRLFTEASLTARPFFERMGFATLVEQVVEVRGVRFVNFRMAKDLGPT